MARGRSRPPASMTAATMATAELPGITAIGAGDWIRWCNYGFPGTGKTSGWATAAAAGMKTLVIRSSIDPVPARALNSGAHEFIADTWEKMLDIQDFLRMSNHGYVWVFWDNVSTHQDVLLDDVWAGTIAEKPGRALVIDRSNARFGKPNLSPTSGLDKGEYGRNMERLQQWLRHVVGCNTFHFAFGAHPHEGPHPTNDQGGDVLRPWVQGKNMPEKFTGYCNMVSFTEVMESSDGKKQWRRLHFRENSRYYAKDGYDAFPKGYMDVTDTTATVPVLMAAVEKARGQGLGNARATTTRARGRGTSTGRGRSK